MVCKYVDQKDLSVMLTSIQLAGVVPEASLTHWRISGGRQGCTPLWFQFLYFRAVFGKHLAKKLGLHPTLGLAHPLWEILDPPL